MAGSAVNSDPHDGEGIKKTIAVGAAGVIPTSPRLRHTHRWSAVIRCQNTGDGVRFRASH